ncbi:MAG: hypothetical protein NC337_04610 [Roseburia sp.]|nr:hypothetical protein [Roseburia sp.]
MAKIMDTDYMSFRQAAEGMKIIIWGAGRLASYYIETFCKDLDVVMIVDNDEKLSGKHIDVDGKSYSVILADTWIGQLKNCVEELKSIIIFITPTSYAHEIILQINQIPMLKDVKCCMGVLMRDKCRACNFKFTQGNEKIPRKIHYCWFGGGEIPDRLRNYMDTWEKNCPDYEIVRWDESNYDITKNKYMKEAYEAKCWGFVPDYARLDIIYQEGGIYLDTDVELLMPLDKLLNDEMFCGFGCNFLMNLGNGFGAVKGFPLIKEFRDYYEGFSFHLSDGTLNKKTCYEYQHPILLKNGFTLENVYQKRGGAVIYPSEVLSPEGSGLYKNYTSNTISVHHCEYSWANECEKEAFETLKRETLYEN